MALLTSLTHPLCINIVYPAAGGQIGLTFCPGKQQAHSISGHWQRDLATDLQVIADWGPAAVLTLMETAELAAVKVAGLGEAVEALGIDWYHLPIRDTQAPGQRFENRWVLYGLKVRRLLRQGRKVLIHCRGGLGRTGTVAARLLVELGEAREDAIAAVRAARRGSIETGVQEAHVRATRALSRNDAGFDRALGCLLGGALGDAFGYAVEFDSLHQIQQRFGAAGLREPLLKEGRLRVSDDTQMTLFTLEGIARAPKAGDDTALIESIRLAYLDWLDTQDGGPPGDRVRGTLARRANMRHARAPGNTCLTALHSGGLGTPERPINNSKGCGAAMRSAPLGWLTSASPETTFARAASSGALTHGHPDGWASAGFLAALIQLLCTGQRPRKAVAQALAVTEAALTRHGVVADLPDRVRLGMRLAGHKGQAAPEAIAALGGGWVGEEAVAIALYAVLTARDFKDAVRRAANHDGDSDSTASIAGQLWGAWKGIDSLPSNWVRRLDVLPECLHGIAAVRERIGPMAATGHASPTEAEDPALGCCRTILQMVHNLHRRGYQRLRIAPGMAPSGCCWRVSVAPAEAFEPAHGARLRDFDAGLHHTTGNGAHPFSWHDAAGLGPDELAELFLERCPALAQRGWGADWAYAGWYLDVLTQASRNLFPIAYFDGDLPDAGVLKLVGRQSAEEATMPAPPRVSLPAPDARVPPTPASRSPNLPEQTASATSSEEDADSVDCDEVDLWTFDLSDEHQRVQALI